MSRTFKDSPHGKEARYRAGKGRQRHILVRSIRRDPPDLSKLSRAIIALALAESEAASDAADEQMGGLANERPAAEEPEGGR
jgi:hypothetical protein